jgi:dolichol-phosphate mannosyltransferase
MAYISVVIPVYKAEKCLRELYQRLKSSLETISKDFEIIMIEDCGGDRSWEIINELVQLDPRVVGLQFSRNFGQHYGITAGLDYCSGEWVVVMDCDLQDRPEEIIKLYRKAQEGFDVVLTRRVHRQDKFIKRITSQMFYQVLNFLAGTNYDAQIGPFRLISKKVVESFRTSREQLRFFGCLIDWMGFPTTVVDVQHSERLEGKSSYNFRKLFKLAFETIIAYSEKPLRVSIILGFLVSVIAFLGGIFIISKAIVNKVSIPGWSSLIVSIYFIGGIVIMNLGVIGIYLGKTFNETKKRPLYIVSKMARHDD